ncbi:MAG: hypothetical protein EPN99_07910 [Frankiales bacterium]|nr:MAG: hypothetical protein EPN99_07910 [Frankiales bacterium]
MNSKLIKACLAGTAAVAVAAGGTTFAAWSDFAVNEDNNVGADILSLAVNDSGTARFDKLTMHPGGSSEFESVVASRTGTAVPTASLKLTLENLLSEENLCASLSEAVLDADCATVTEGEFDDQAIVTMNVSDPIPSISSVATPCNSTLYPRGNALSANGFSGAVSIKALRDASAVTPLDLLKNGTPAGTVLNAGEGVCVAMAITLPVTADNAVQGDEVTFDLRFLLDQIV